MLADIRRLWRTVRHLKPIQIYGRIFFRLFKPSHNTCPAPSLREASVKWTEAARRRPSMIGPSRFRFLNEVGSIDSGWNDRSKSKLWLYNLHYFDDLNAHDNAFRNDWHCALIDRWISENAPGRGNGWEPYPTSLRIVNWIKWSAAGQALSPQALHSLAIQVRWLAKRIEWHLLGNHLFANAKALLFAGLYFEGEEAQTWFERARQILLAQIAEQVLPDGAQFELSPMYHVLATEDMLDLVNIMQAYSHKSAALLDECTLRIPSMLKWMRAMCHPDGEIAFFNDAAFGIAPTPVEIFEYAKRLGFETPDPYCGSMYLDASGYARLVDGEAVLIADAARVGPDYIPGHAHADSLSFEFSLGQQRVLVNSGTSVYGAGKERLRQRGTAAHNTVTVDGENSSEVWGGFRVGRRATVWLDKCETHRIEASHNGYAHLVGSPIHRREWTLKGGLLSIVDHIADDAPPSEARFHLHPDVSITRLGLNAGNFVLCNGSVIAWTAEGGNVRVEQSNWHPEFGTAVPNQVLVVPLQGGLAKLNLRWG
jgi:uncharacterized heparinase superfamily protein